MNKKFLQYAVFTFVLAFLSMGLSSCGSVNKPNAEQSVSNKTLDSAALVEKYWKLLEVDGSAVVFTDDWVREPYMILKANENKINGSSGCNSFFGTYTLIGTDHIKFTDVGSTKMACRDMEIEQKFFKALEKANSYMVNGDTLLLKDARNAPIAKFEAVYMK